MSRAHRAFRALVSLIVLTLSVAEGVRAAACPPGAMPGAPATVDGAAGDHPGGAGQHPANGAHRPGDGAQRPDGSAHRVGDGAQRPGGAPSPAHHDAPACPFGPLGALRGCTAAASLPSLPAPDLALSPESPDALPGAEVPHTLLLGTDLFRPPRS